MRYSIDLEIQDDKETVKQLLEKDLDNLKTDRSKIVIDDNNGLNVRIEGQDATAVRASVNNVLKILQVYEKARELK